MLKAITKWSTFTLLSGLLSILIKLIIFISFKSNFNYSDFCSEVFLFSLILAFDGIENFVESKEKNSAYWSIFLLLLFFTMFLLIFYVISLINDYGKNDLNTPFLYTFSFIFASGSIIFSIIIQCQKGAHKI